MAKVQPAPVHSPKCLDADDSSVYAVTTKAKGPSGSLPLSDEMLKNWPSGDLFGLVQNAGMGWTAAEVARDPFLILSTQGGLRAADGHPIALGYHTGHWEVGILVEEAALELKRLGMAPFAGMVSDPCDGRTQGTAGMMDSLPYRNDAAIVFRRLIRSLPRRKGVLGIATCDKGLPAMMMALAGSKQIAGLLMPGGVTLPPEEGEDAGKIQSIGARYAHGEISLVEAAEMGCRACASPGGGCQFLGTAATSQVVAEALGITIPHAALAPSGQPIWRDLARRSARALVDLVAREITMGDVLTNASIRNAMVVHAAFGGSTNLLLHIPAIAFAAGLRRPTVDDWHEVNLKVPRLVSVLPNGPFYHPTVRAYLAGGVPEVMLHLRALDLLDLSAMTVTGEPLGPVLTWWEKSERRKVLRDRLFEQDAVNPDDVIMSPSRAKEQGLTSTVTFPRGNLAPQGSVIKSTAIDPSVVDPDGIYRKTGPARVFTREHEAIAAIKGQGEKPIRPGDVLVLIGRGPAGAGMEEIYQITAALRYLSFGKQVAVLTDARFSGVSTGACIGHVSPEALAGGPIGRLRDGDSIRIIVDRVKLEGSLDLVAANEVPLEPAEADQLLSSRSPHPLLSADPALPDDTRLWAALQNVGGGTWGGCVYDTEAIIAALKAGARD
jgi:putative YjhG/YagF family dehydratase